MTFNLLVIISIILLIIAVIFNTMSIRDILKLFEIEKKINEINRSIDKKRD
jgi:hypothetical protein